MTPDGGSDEAVHQEPARPRTAVCTRRRAVLRRVAAAACLLAGLWGLQFQSGAERARSTGGGLVLRLPSALAADPDTLLEGGDVYVVPVGGTIDLGLAPFIARVIEEAEGARARAVILVIDTFGGRLDAAVLIRDALLRASVPTLAFVDPRAISAGALITLACEKIAMAPGGSIGAATPVTGGTGGEMEAADEKVISYFRAEMRTTAERRERRGDLAAAMVDPDVEIEGVIEKGKLLTLTTQDALELGLVDFVGKTLDEVLDAAGYPDVMVVERESNWAERLARVVSNPAVSSLLLSIGFLGILIELYQPGWGIPGTVGIVSLLVFFFGHYVVRLAGLEEMLLFVLGVGLLFLELLVIPGFGIAGIAGIGAMLAAVLLAMLGLDWRTSWNLGFVNQAISVLTGTIVTVLVGGFLAVKLLPRSRVASPFVLKDGLATDAGYTSHGPETAARFPLGTEGLALTDLHPSGTVRLLGHRVDAVSEGGFIAHQSRVVVVGYRTGNVVVKLAPGAAPGETEP